MDAMASFELITSPKTSANISIGFDQLALQKVTDKLTFFTHVF